MVLRGSHPDQLCQLDQPGAELDVVFDLIGGTLTLRETVQDPIYHDASYTICLMIESKYMRFVNLKALPDKSLLLSLRIRSSGGARNRRKMTIKERYYGFSPSFPDSRLYKDIYECDWSEQNLEIILPEYRIKSWKTVALILRTFKRITPENWCDMVNMDLKKTPSVAGLDWMILEKEMVAETQQMSSQSEGKKRYGEFEQKETRLPEQKSEIAVQC